MSAPKRPIVWLEYRHEDTAGNTVTYRWSREDIADLGSFEGGWKEGRAVSIGPISRNISDSAGEHELASASVDLDDTDALWRTLLDTDSTAYVDGRTAVIRAYSDAQRAAAGASTVLMRGLARQVNLSDGRGASLTIEDVLGSEFGPLPLDKSIPQRKFRREVFPQLHRDLLEQVVPIIYGEVSDEGAVDSAGEASTKGLVPGFYVGDFELDGVTPTTGTPLPPPSWAITYTTFGSGGSNTYTYAVSVRTATGRTELGGFVTISGLPSPSAFSPTNGVTLHLAQYEASLQALVTGIDLYVKDGAADSGSPYHYMDAAGHMFNTAPGTPFAGGYGYDDNGDDDHYKTWNPPPATNTSTTDAWGLIVFAGHAIHELLGLYGSDGGDDADGVAPTREAWTVGAMDDVIDPTSANWPHANPYIDLTGTDGVTERVYGIYVQGPRLQHHIDGRITIAANICGIEDVGDGTGELIDQAFRAWQHMLSEWVLGNSGKGYYTGTWAGLPTFGDSVAMINTDAVDAAETRSEVFLGTTKGYLAGFTITQPLTVRDWMRVFNRTFTAYSYTNRFGQLAIALVNTGADPDTGTTLREDVDDVIVVRAPHIQTDRVENKIEYQLDWDADGQLYRSELLTVQSTASQTNHKATRTNGPYELFCTRDIPTATDAMGRRLALYQRAPIVVPVTTGASGFGLDLFDQVRISGHEGLGASGYVLRPALIIGRTDRPDDGEVDLECWDLGPITGLDFGIQGTTDTTWGDMTTSAEVWGDMTTTSARWG
jgi:hypothetical protein